MEELGLTETEAKTHVQEYNHALFRNMMFFLDVACEINIPMKTIVVLADKGAPERKDREYSFAYFFTECMEKYVIEEEKAFFAKMLDFEQLAGLQEETSFQLHLCRNGKEAELHNFVLTPSFDEKHVSHYVYLSAKNIQAEVRRELEEHQRQKQFLELLVQKAYFYFSFDVTGDGLITEDAVSKNGGYLISEIAGKEMPVLFEDFVAGWFESFAPQFENSEDKQVFTREYLLNAYQNNESLIELETEQRCGDESTPSSLMQIFIVLMEQPSNKHIYATVIWNDLSGVQKRAMQDNMELRNSNEDLRKTLNQEQQYRMASLSGALMVYNINLTRNLIEEEFYEIVDEQRIPMLAMFGLTPPCDFGEFCRRWCETKVSEESRETFLRLFNREYMLSAYKNGERHLETEFDTVLGRGIRVTLRNTAFLLEDKDSGDIVAMVNSKDVSRQRQEEQRQREMLRVAYEAANTANTVKTDFLTRMSHDIRTPMNAIVGMTSMAMRHLDNVDRVSECLKEISGSGKYLLSILSEIMDMSKIEAGKLELVREEFDLSHVLEDIFTICRFQCEEKKHMFSVTDLKLEHKKVIGDARRLQQALMNLTDNAIKYTPDNGSIHFSAIEKPSDRPDMACYEFLIDDSGIGMDEDYLEHLFEPFTRSEDRRVAKIQGIGLGLPISKNIFQMMDGNIEVKSKLNMGTTVTVKIYLGEA